MRRLWLYGALTLLACSLMVGAGGYSTMAADRGVNLAVAEDSSAYLGIDDGSEVHLVDDGSSETALGLTNNFAQSDPSVSASVPGEAPIEVTDASFRDGVEVSCKRVKDRASVPISLTATGSDTTVEVTRSVTVTCEAPPIETEDIKFTGCNNLKVTGHSAQFPLNVTLIGVSKKGNSNETFVTHEREIEQSGKTVAGGNFDVAGLQVHDQQHVEEIVVTNPNYADANCSGSANGNSTTGDPGDPRD
jgi:hypothetical protein